MINYDRYIKNAESAYEINSKVWECFYRYSFRSPKIFFSIFGNYLDKEFNSHIKEFYDIFPESLVSSSDSINKMLIEENIYDRSMFLLKNCSKEGFFRFEDLDSIDDMIYYIYRGIMSKLLSSTGADITEDSFTSKAMDYTNRIFDSFKL